MDAVPSPGSQSSYPTKTSRESSLQAQGHILMGSPGFLPGQFIHALGTSPRKGDGEIEPEDEESVQGQMGAYAFLDSHT